MKIEVGMYVRTNYGIGKVDDTRMFMNNFQFHLDSDKGNIHNVSDNTYWNHLEDIIGEPVHNPIELIEVDDYVNGYKVSQIGKSIENRKYITTEAYHKINYGNVFEKEIETIVTKEQFEREAYKI